jgi:hypothetical protein
VLTSALFLSLIAPTAFAAGITRVLGIRRPDCHAFDPEFLSPAREQYSDRPVRRPLRNIFLLPDARQNATAAVTIPVLIGNLLSLPLGVLLLSSANPAIMKRVIALVILIAALTLLCGWRPFPRPIGVAGWGAVGALTELSWVRHLSE